MRDQLLVTLQCRQLHLSVESHRCSFNNKDEPDNKRHRQQNTGATFQQQVPEVTNRIGCLGGHCLEDSGKGGHPGSCRDKLEEHDHEQLGKIGQSAFPTIVLEITIDHKTDAGIERQV